MSTPDQPTRNAGRIEILDGLRALAILLVIGFHYFSRWTLPRHTQNFYPWGSSFAEVPVFSLGYLGVELFFIVSGFVISMTLFGSSGPLDFARRRFARLVPTMVLCSLITFAFLSISNAHMFAVRPRDFIASLSFVDPDFLHLAFGGQFGVVDAAYWSLFVEVKFYAWACLLFFVSRPQRFIRNFSAFYGVVLLLDVGTRMLHAASLARVVELLLFPEYLGWFAAGVGFYFLFKREHMPWAIGLVLLSLSVRVATLAHTSASSTAEWALSLAFYALFAAFVFRPHWMTPFSWRPMVTVGGASYSLYLLHQRIGVSLIADIAHAAGLWGQPLSLLIGAAVAIGCIGISLAIYRYWELPSKHWLLRVSRRAAPPAAVRAARAD